MVCRRCCLSGGVSVVLLEASIKVGDARGCGVLGPVVSDGLDALQQRLAALQAEDGCTLLFSILCLCMNYK